MVSRIFALVTAQPIARAVMDVLIAARRVLHFKRYTETCRASNEMISRMRSPSTNTISTKDVLLALFKWKKQKLNKAIQMPHLLKARWTPLTSVSWSQVMMMTDLIAGVISIRIFKGPSNHTA